MRLDRVNWIFAEYLEQRGYIDEAGFTFLTAGDLEASMEAFSKALNLDMVFSVAAQRKLPADELQKLKLDLIERLRNSSRFEDAGDLVDPVSDFDLALDCYLKSNNF